MCKLKPGSNYCKDAIQKATDSNKASGCIAVNSVTTCGCQSLAPAAEKKKAFAASAVMAARKQLKNVPVVT